MNILFRIFWMFRIFKNFKNYHVFQWFLVLFRTSRSFSRRRTCICLQNLRGKQQAQLPRISSRGSRGICFGLSGLPEVFFENSGFLFLFCFSGICWDLLGFSGIFWKLRISVFFLWGSFCGGDYLGFLGIVWKLRISWLFWLFGFCFCWQDSHGFLIIFWKLRMSGICSAFWGKRNTPNYPVSSCFTK